VINRYWAIATKLRDTKVDKRLANKPWNVVKLTYKGYASVGGGGSWLEAVELIL